MSLLSRRIDPAGCRSQHNRANAPYRVEGQECSPSNRWNGITEATLRQIRLLVGEFTVRSIPSPNSLESSARILTQDGYFVTVDNRIRSRRRNDDLVDFEHCYPGPLSRNVQPLQYTPRKPPLNPDKPVVSDLCICRSYLPFAPITLP